MNAARGCIACHRPLCDVQCNVRHLEEVIRTKLRVYKRVSMLFADHNREYTRTPASAQWLKLRTAAPEGRLEGTVTVKFWYGSDRSGGERVGVKGPRYSVFPRSCE